MRTHSLIMAALLTVGCGSRGQLPLRTAIVGPCVPFGSITTNRTWLTGDYRVVPVTAEHQAEIMQRLKRGEVQKVDAAVAGELSGGATAQAAHYYIMRVGYVGDAPPGTVGRGLSMGADVDTDGVAYVSSFVLSRSSGTTELAAILSSPTPVKRAVSSCGAAE